eukprot:CAMPEP_0184863392 /NCGR_PEP_ID=MMETSP0580-20130426/10882_1 /TAXON_ID=1118495 /ORGANISM="Dactyliosolen fragilissimus" /LENGTH=314 /DNA_ID=CAMNT_0027361699 /DNA_START=362 /DNA_END=1306 /DNA_ORIENTATION=-
MSCGKAPLEKLGYTVLEKETPIDPNEIRGDFLREHVVKTGCCGEKEFLKLYAYTLMDHPVVVHLDLDSLVLSPLDDLFDAMLLPASSSFASPNIPTMFDRPLPQRIEAFFTRDYNMVNLGKEDVGVQGGFLVVRPSMEYFEEYKQIILEGNFVSGAGWDRKYGGYFGAQQIQGLCAYFFDGVHPGTAVELNRCIYNQMVDNPKRKTKSGEAKCLDLTDHCEDCRKTDISKIKLAHFTICQKPWLCPTGHITGNNIIAPLCRELHQHWFLVRKDFDEYRGMSSETIGIGSHMSDVYHGYCKSSGKGYIPIELDIE